MKKYIIEVAIDEDILKSSKQDQLSEEEIKLLSVKDMIIEEMGWARESGIYTQKVREADNKKVEDLWDFILKYYPDYDHCEEITRESDLFKLVEKEYEEGDDAHTMLVEEYKGNINNPEIYKDWRDCLCEIYEEAIKGYIKQQ